MRTKPLLIALLITVPTLIYAQNVTKQEKGYFNITEFGYTGGNHEYEIQVTPNKYEGNETGAYAFSLRNINGIFLTNNIAIGAGVGLKNYTDNEEYFETNNLFQLFLDVRYYFKNANRTFFAYGDAGRNIKIADNFNKGQMFNLGIGYKFKVGPKTGMTGSFGYSDNTIKENPLVTRNRYYGFAFKVGLMF